MRARVLAVTQELFKDLLGLPGDAVVFAVRVASGTGDLEFSVSCEEWPVTLEGGTAVAGKGPSS